MERYYDLSDIVLIPAAKNNGHPGEKADLTVTDKYDRTGPLPRSLPIFTSPMDSVVGCRTANTYMQNGIKPIIPLTEKIGDRLNYSQGMFSCFTLDEIERHFLSSQMKSQYQFRICIEDQNGQQQRLFDVASRLKKFYGPQVIIMAGRVARAEIYSEYSRAGIDYMRVGLASGSLVDHQKFGFHYPMASLLESIKTFKKSGGLGLPRTVNIVVDGGITCPSDIIKALALGADYVMIGAEFARCVEAEGPIYKRVKGDKTIETKTIDPKDIIGLTGTQAKAQDFQRQYRGCTTPEIQARVAGFPSLEEWIKAGAKPNPSDSNWRWISVDKNLSDWINEFRICAENAFMMTGATNWEEFKKTVTYGAYLC